MLVHKVQVVVQLTFLLASTVGGGCTVGVGMGAAPYMEGK